VLDLVVDPLSPDTLYAATLPGTVFRSLDQASTWTEVGSSISDGAVSLGINPLNPAVLLAGTLSSGAYRTTDYGATWDSVNVGLTSREVRAIAVDPVDTSIVYAGTSGGLFKSANGGVSWSAAGLTGVTITDIALNPMGPDTVYVGTDGQGVYESTDGLGAVTQVNSGLGSLRIVALAVHPTHPDTLYAATLDAGVYRSGDGAVSWSAANTGLSATAMTSLVLSPASPSVLFVGTAASEATQVYKSTDNAQNWHDLTGVLPAAIAVGALAAHPDSLNMIYAGLDSVHLLRQTGLDPVTILAAGSAPRPLVAADLNGDSLADVATGNSGQQTVSVYLNQAQGAAFSRTDYRSGSGPAALAAGDLDRDGDIDLAVANKVKQTVSLLLNDGSGGFGTPSDLYVGVSAGMISAADLDGDLDLDIAVGGEGSGEVYGFSNDGRGSFGAPTMLHEAFGLSNMRVADLSGDGRADIVVLSRLMGAFTVLVNAGGQTFSEGAGIATCPSPAHLTTGDYDIDGDTDLAVAGGSTTVYVHPNEGGGTFGVPVSYTLSDTAAGLVSADVDRDGYLDLVVSEGGGQVSLLANNGSGGFGSATSLGNRSGLGQVAAADFSANDRLDVVVSQPGSGTLVILANSVAQSIKAPAPPRAVTASDRQADLGDNVTLEWMRPLVDESTGRASVYRIYRATAESGPFEELARVDTSGTSMRDSLFVTRTYVDSSATVGETFYYYVRCEDTSGGVSTPSDTVHAVSRAQPFFDFAFSGSIPFHIQDTVRATVRLNPVAYDIQGFSLFIDYDTRAFRLLDSDANVAGVQPFSVDAALASEAQVLQNRLDPSATNRLNYALGFLPEAESGPVPVGSLQLVALRDTVTTLRVVSDTSANRQTALTSRTDGALVQPYIPPASRLVLRYHRLPGGVAFQGRSGDLGIDVRFDLTQTDSLGSPLPDSSAYRPPNDSDAGRAGVQTRLATDGSFQLVQVPSGRYGLFVKSHHYLRARVLGDSVVVNDSLGVSTPVSFQWTSADSTIVSASLRAGDANDDNRVSLADFGVLAASFGSADFSAADPAWGADFNGDEVVNLADFALLQSNFGEQGEGRSVPARPAPRVAQLALCQSGESTWLGITGARGVTGFAADLVYAAAGGKLSVSGVPGEAWGALQQPPMMLSRRIPREDHQVYRVAVAAAGGVGIREDGEVLRLRGLVPGSDPEMHLERVEILYADGSVSLGDWQQGLGHGALPQRVELLQNHPNPFNPETVIPFSLPRPAQVVVRVYTPLGQLVRTLVQETRQAGYHSVVWDGRDRIGREVASGVYVCHLTVGDVVDVVKAVLLR